MSKATSSGEATEHREDRLDQLYELREEFRIVAGTDTPFASYAENALDTLREAGYDV